MIEVERTITIRNDGHDWTLTMGEARRLRTQLDLLLPAENASRFSANHDSLENGVVVGGYEPR